MFTIRIGGIEVTCEGAADAAALIAALGERGAARLLPDAAVGRAADTISGSPPSRATRTPRARVAPAAPAPKSAGQRPFSRGRKPTWTPEELKAIGARVARGERLDELAAERGKSTQALWQALKKQGLPTKFVAQSAPAVRRLAPGESGVEDAKGTYRKAG